MTLGPHPSRPRPAPRFQVDADKPEYVWQQVFDHLVQRIEAGQFERRLPNREVLAAEYGVSLHSVARAVRALAERGLVVTLRGKGTYLT
ncbi:winged helix-turn-helix domain-containing protein [Qaidamihabitans albus]|uniref:winged helix-turn-helix domain-containing protein n=1 Tax=Qaidamihabitans albus TaxID=2795733 RepID=UPI0018F22570|nr:winged helix-turn-helix domain-containing protein [Qaidamihabitans albus]